MSTMNHNEQERVITIPAGKNLISTLCAELEKAIEQAVQDGALTAPRHGALTTIHATPYETIDGKKVTADEIDITLFDFGSYIWTVKNHTAPSDKTKDRVLYAYDGFVRQLHTREICTKQAQVNKLLAEIEELKNA